MHYILFFRTGITLIYLFVLQKKTISPRKNAQLHQEYPLYAINTEEFFKSA